MIDLLKYLLNSYGQGYLESNDINAILDIYHKKGSRENRLAGNNRLQVKDTHLCTVK